MPTQIPSPLFEEYKDMNYLEYREFMSEYYSKLKTERMIFLENKYLF
jgi:hypothetical protein